MKKPLLLRITPERWHSKVVTVAIVLGTLAMLASVTFTFFAFPIVMTSFRPEAPISRLLLWGKSIFGIFGAHIVFGVPYWILVMLFSSSIASLPWIRKTGTNENGAQPAATDNAA
jgi:hypothetical protein